MRWLRRVVDRVLGRSTTQPTEVGDTWPESESTYDAVTKGDATPTFLCVCDEEWCWCPTLVTGFNRPCADCRAGHHVWTKGGLRA